MKEFLKYFLFFIVFTYPYLSVSIELKTEEFAICTYKSATGLISRSIYIHKFRDKLACLTVYRKANQDQVVANGKWFGFCQKIKNKIEKNLKKDFWTCKNVEGVNIFYSDKELKKLNII